MVSTVTPVSALTVGGSHESYAPRAGAPDRSHASNVSRSLSGIVTGGSGISRVLTNRSIQYEIG